MPPRSGAPLPPAPLPPAPPGVDCRLRRLSDDEPDTRPDQRVADLASREWGVLHLDELRRCGLTRDGVHDRVRAGWLHPKFRAVFAVGHPNVPVHGAWLAAVKACGPTAVLSDFAAGAATGMIDWEARPVDVTIAGTAPRAHRGVRVHRRALHPRDVVVRDGIRMTSPARTLLDLAARLPPRALREAVRRGEALDRVTVADLARILVRLRGRRGATRLAAIVARGDVPTRSVLEDTVFDLLGDAGFARPDVNVALSVERRKVIPDFRWPAERLVVEVDGAKWHDGALARADDGERQALLEAHGERVLRVTWDQAVTRPTETIARIRAAGAPRA